MELCLRPDYTIPVCLHHLTTGDPRRRGDYAYLGPVFRQRPGETGSSRRRGSNSIGRSDATAAHYDRVVTTGLVLVSVITAVVVVAVGNIPFLGLVVPNLVTLLLGDNLRRALPVTALVGAFFVLCCDVLGRTIRHPYEIPVETIAGVVGAGLFIFLVLRARRRTA